MNTGQVISGACHAGLIAWAVLGGAFQAEPLPFEVTEVTAISSEDYALLIRQQESPEAVANVDTPEPPEEGETAPELQSETDEAPELDQPEVADTPPPDDIPEVDETPPAEAEVSDEPPILEPPQEDVAVIVPDESSEPKPRPAPRVAPEPVAQPEPDVEIDEVQEQESVPDETTETPREDTEATSPEEATTEIVTEAEEPSNAAPASSLRPRSRPARAEPPDEPDDEDRTAEDNAAPEVPETDNSSVADALAEAIGETESESTAAPQGPPLTRGEKDALRVAVQQCWNVGSLSSEALQTTVVIGVGMTEDGRPVVGSIEMLSSSGGGGSATKQAYEAARRAIIRCGADGFNLPVEKYDHWRDIEMTFNPERMRIK